MRFPIRSLATLVMMVGVATCSDTPIAAVKTGSSPSTRFGVGQIALAPVFSKAAQYAAAHLADFPTVRFDSVRVVIRGIPDTTKVIKDTTVFFDVNSTELQLELDVPVQNDGQRFRAGMDYRGPSGVVFHGVQDVQSHRPDQPAPEQQPILIDYVGVGSNVKTITVAPHSVSLVGNQASTLTVTAVDANNNTIAVPLAFRSSNTSIATVSNTGLVQAQNRRGNATITVQTPSGVIDNATVSVSLTPAAIGATSGNGQTGKVGSTLANPAVVQVSASDGIGVPGVSVIFAAPTGGSVSPTTATTDANGRASTTMKLGPKAGPQGFTATAAGVSTAINVTATPADPSALTILSGNNQSDSVRATLALSVRVSDSFDNPIAGATVSWSKTGGGSLGKPTSTTDVDGIATNSYTLGSAIGTESVTASTGSATAVFAFTVGGGRPASIVAVSGNAQTGKISQSLANPLVVKVADAAGNPVRDAAITWTAQNATIASATPSDAKGQASANVTLGTATGSASINAAIAGGATVRFSATVQPGTPATMFFTAQPTSAVATLPLPPVRVALRDAGNNPADGTVTIALVNATNGAVLGGTLSQSTSDGVATFGNLTIDRVGTGYTLRVSANGLTATSNPFNATAGAAASLSIVAGNGTSAKVNTVVPTAPSVRLVDNANNPIIGASVTFTLGSGGGSVAPAGGIVTTDALGMATLTSWTLGTTMGTQTLTASAPGVQPVTFTATAEPGNAFKLVLRNKSSLQSSVISGALLSPQPTIQLTDEFGNAVPAGQMQVSVSAMAGATVSGSLAAVLGATSGSWAFTDLKLAGTTATKLVFRESSGQIKPDTSSAISIGVGQATRIRLVTTSSTPTAISVVAGQTAVLPQVRAEDANGNAIAGVTIHAVVDSGVAPNTAVLGAEDFVTNASGLASLAAPVATAVGTYRLTATSAGIADILQITATVTAGPAYRVAFKNRSSLSTSVTSGVVLSPQPTIWVVDQYGNPVSASGVNVTLTTAPSSALSAPLSLGSLGFATYSGVSLNGNGTMRLVVTATGTTLAPDSSSSIFVNAATAPPTATQIERYGVSSFSGIVGVSLATRPAVLVKDASGNPVAGTAIVFALTPDTIAIDGTRRADTVMTNNLGVATMSVWKLPTVVGTYSLSARPKSGSLTSSPVTFTASTLAGAVDTLAFVRDHGAPASFENNSIFSNGPQLRAADAYGNPIVGIAIDATVESSTLPSSTMSRPGPSAALGFFTDLPTMSIGSATTNASGVADFSGVKFRGKVQSFRLRFTARGTSVGISTPTALRHGSMNKAICTASLPGRVGLGHRLSNSPKLQLIDIDSNLVDNTPVTLTSTGSLSSNNGTSDSNGEVTVSTWTVRGSAGDDSLKVSGLSGGCKVTAAAVHHIKLSLTSLGRKKNGDLIPSIDATVVDIDGNAIEDTTFTIDALAHSTQGKSIFISKSKSSNGRGKTTFDSLTVDAEAQTGATLDFSVSGASTVTGQITLDVDDGDASDLDNSDVPSSALGAAGQDLDNAFTVNIRDHNKRNGLTGSSVQNVLVTWSKGTESGCSEVSFPNGNTSLTASNGRATSPRIHLGSTFAAPCTITAKAILSGVPTSVDFSIRQ